MSVHLPLAGGTGARGAPPAVMARDARRPMDVRAVVVAAATSGLGAAAADLASSIVRAAAERRGGGAAIVVTEAEEGAERASKRGGGVGARLREAGAAEVVWMHAGPEAAGDAVEGAVRAVAGRPWVVVIGAAVAGFRRPWLTVVIDGGLPPGAWEPWARAIRDRIDVRLAEARPAYAAGLGERLGGG